MKIFRTILGILFIILFFIGVILWFPLMFNPEKTAGAGDWIQLIAMIVGSITIIKWGYERIEKFAIKN